MKAQEAQSEITRLIEKLFCNIGGNANDIAHIIPKDGGWGKALSYEVCNKEGKRIRVFRKYIDDKEHETIKIALRGLR